MPGAHDSALLKHVSPGHVLELGFMDGQWTDRCRVTIVEGASRNAEFGRRKYAGNTRVTVTRVLFEEHEPPETYDCVHMGGMLKHMEDPVGLLRRARGWLKPGGLLIATTPNARSLHRRVGVHMGLLENLDALSPTDRTVGNRRHYDLGSFRALLEDGGFGAVEIATAMLKPVSSQQMQDWPDALLDALDHVADEVPDLGWHLYAICR